MDAYIGKTFANKDSGYAKITKIENDVVTYDKGHYHSSLFMEYISLDARDVTMPFEEFSKEYDLTKEITHLNWK